MVGTFRIRDSRATQKKIEKLITISREMRRYSWKFVLNHHVVGTQIFRYVLHFFMTHHLYEMNY